MGAGIPPVLIVPLVIIAMVMSLRGPMHRAIDHVKHAVHSTGCGVKKVFTGHGCAPADESTP